MKWKLFYLILIALPLQAFFLLPSWYTCERETVAYPQGTK